MATKVLFTRRGGGGAVIAHRGKNRLAPAVVTEGELELLQVGVRYQGITGGRRAEPRRPPREGSGKKMLRNDERSQHVYENKGHSDTMPEKKSDIYV